MGNSSTRRYRRKGRKTKQYTRNRRTRSYRNKRVTLRRKSRGSKRRRRTNSRKKRGRKQSGGGFGHGFTGSNPGALHGGHYPVSSYSTC
tara:strand:- start:506 stop:772 length:267 start_codon:yes stop_codon:yes gene_type:complete